MNSIEPVVGALIVNRKGEILLVSGPKWKGAYTIVGGHIEHGESVEDALRRELREEIGVMPDRLEFLHVSEAVAPPWFHRPVHFIFLTYVGWIDAECKVVLSPEEFTGHMWVNPSEALKNVHLVDSVPPVIKDYMNKFVEKRENKDVVRAGVQVFVFDSARKLLLLKRNKIFGHDTWALPGGHLEVDETIEEGALRELYEETGIKGDIQSAKVQSLASAFGSRNNRHIQIAVLVDRWAGEPEVREAHKCSEIGFFPFESLPEPLFSSSKPLIEKFKRQVFY